MKSSLKQRNQPPKNHISLKNSHQLYPLYLATLRITLEKSMFRCHGLKSMLALSCCKLSKLISITIYLSPSFLNISFKITYYSTDPPKAQGSRPIKFFFNLILRASYGHRAFQTHSDWPCIIPGLCVQFSTQIFVTESAFYITLNFHCNKISLMSVVKVFQVRYCRFQRKPDTPRSPPFTHTHRQKHTNRD